MQYDMRIVFCWTRWLNIAYSHGSIVEQHHADLGLVHAG
jgi:hypothetical protein